MTLDGKIATHSRDSRWISNETSRRRVHQLRGQMDAIVVGRGTVLADDPLLTARPSGPRDAVRIVLASQVDIPLDCQLCQTARQHPLLIAASKPIPEDRWEAARLLGAEVFGFAPGADGRPEVSALLRELGRRRMTNVLVEGGAEVLGSFLDAHLIDEVHVFIAPRLIGGGTAPGPIAGVGVEKLAAALGLADVRVELLDGDILVRGRMSQESLVATNGLAASGACHLSQV
jgi:diaminohydroxyphosphoribosylaminopyrimidine deaminase/5-amino-6-(5-phosphoribosylamino)uracil reductase